MDILKDMPIPIEPQSMQNPSSNRPSVKVWQCVLTTTIDVDALLVHACH